MRKFRLHPLFIAMCAGLLLLGKSLVLLNALLAVLLHEAAHAVVARRRGYVINMINLTPFGASLGTETGLNDNDLFFVAAAGPLANIVVGIVLLALWWIFPALYVFTADFFDANIAIGIFNLLPLYPLDGARLLLSGAKDKLKTLKIMRAGGYVAAAISLVLFVVSAFYDIAYSLALISLTFFCGAAFEAKREKYIRIAARVLKDFSAPVERKEYYLHFSAKISSLKRKLRGEYYYVVRIIDENFRVLKTLNQDELELLLSENGKKKISDILKI